MCTKTTEDAVAPAMPTSRKKMALLDGLDQYSAYYSVICVFGSVVGCVVVPLITQVGGREGAGVFPVCLPPGRAFSGAII